MSGIVKTLETEPNKIGIFVEKDHGICGADAESPENLSGLKKSDRVARRHFYDLRAASPVCLLDELKSSMGKLKRAVSKLNNCKDGTLHEKVDKCSDRLINVKFLIQVLENANESSIELIKYKHLFNDLSYELTFYRCPSQSIDSVSSFSDE
jgi:hypothetical protein